MTTLIADCEANALLGPDLKRLYMVQVGDADGSDAVLYVDFDHLPAELSPAWTHHSDLGLAHEIRPIAEGLERLRAADRYVFHNGLGYDLDAINQFCPGTIDQSKLLDTLVMARLAFPEERDHTLRAWGKRVGVLKDEYKGDYQSIDAAFLRYSEQDVTVGRALWNKVKHVLAWGNGEAVAIEHAAARAIILQERNGWTLDVKRAEALAADLRGELDGITTTLEATFPPLRRERVFIPKRDNKTLGRKAGVPEVTYHMEEFNPGSRRHCAERLKMAGWVPKEFNKDSTPKLDEKILASLPYPEAEALQGYFTTTKMLGQLSDGKEGWLRHVKPDGRVHGRVNPNGCVTGRMAHSKPNLGNVDSDPRMRSCFIPRAGWLQVGADAEGLEARMLGHYLHRWDNGNYTRIVLEGNSDDRTDVHSANLRAMIRAGLVPKSAWDQHFKPARHAVKSILYGLMYGAQDPKLGSMLVELLKSIGVRPPALPNRERGALVRKAIATAIVGFDKLTDAVKARAKERKYLIGLDGRHLPVRSQHAALNTLLQGGGAIVMKKALALFMASASDFWGPHGGQWALTGNIHDEIQLEANPSVAEEIGDALADSIRLAGEHFNLRCPLAGKASIGNSWAETH